MDRNTEKCPICNTEIIDHNLVETEGWFECKKCKNKVQLLKYCKARRYPVYSMEDAVKLLTRS